MARNEENGDIREGELVTLEAPKYDAADDALGTLDDEVFSDLNHALNELGIARDDTTTLFKFYRVNEETGKQSFLFDLENPTPEMKYVNRIQKNYGTGLYCCHIFINGTLRKKPRFAVEVPKTETAPQNENSGMRDILQMFMNEARQSREEFRQMMQSQAAKKEGAKETFEMLSAAREIFGQKSGGMSIENITAIGGLVTPLMMPFIEKWAAQKVANSDDPVSTLEKMIGIVDKFKGLTGDSSGEGKGLLGTLQEMMPELMKAMNNMRGQNNPQQVTATPIPQQNPQIARTPMETPQQVHNPLMQNAVPAQNLFPAKNEENEEMIEIKMALQLLIQKADSNADVKETAISLLDLIPDKKLDAAMTIINAPDAVDQLGRMNEGVLSRRQWFEDLRVAILDQFADEEESVDTVSHEPDNSATDGDTKRKGGDAGNASDNEKSGEGGGD